MRKTKIACYIYNDAENIRIGDASAATIALQLKIDHPPFLKSFPMADYLEKHSPTIHFNEILRNTPTMLIIWL
jgi:hypothetical protein